jgi:predicted RNase H-like nuclease
VPVRITSLDPRADVRGRSFGVGVPFDRVEECHVATVRSGAVRGNHFHTHRRELLVVLYADRWTLLWDDGENTPLQSRTFEGAGAVLMDADPYCAHAVRNDGASDLQIFVLGDTREGETFPRRLAEPLTRIAGVDGCRRGWIAAIKDGANIDVRVVSSDEDLSALFGACAVVAIDIPIGLADRGPRPCDHHARRFLGRRGSSVFPAPLRPLIAVRDYADANRISRQLQQRGISRQGFAIVRKVEQIDRILQRHHELRGRVYEVHPEVSFAMWSGGAPVEASKKTAEGQATRRKLVTEHFGEIPPVPRGAATDDLLDALAALWTAERIAAGRAQELGDAHLDVTGLPMRIVY